MNEQRMIDRGLNPVHKESGLLEGYTFIINKKSSKFKGISFANIKPRDDSFVEGILYTLSSEKELEKLDKFEGYPKHYNRKLLFILNDLGTPVMAYVYTSQPEWETKTASLTTEEYNQLLEQMQSNS
jgi:gamma-glutamylcyclotransferase (GGCT)/AIG2-like uncharacterized protein YtfP